MSSGHLAYIARMPVTKTITRVTIGDIGLPDGCATPTSWELAIRENAAGDTRDNISTAVAFSTRSESIPLGPGKVQWSFSPTTLRAGRAYTFRLVGGSGCTSSLKQVTWPHGNIVDGGDSPCSWGPRSDANGVEQADLRMWHVQGQDDRDPACATAPENAYDFDPSMPTGWLVTYIWQWGSRVKSGSNWSTEPDATTLCGTRDANAGAKVVRWRDSPGSPSGGSDYVCMWPQYADLHARPTDGWHYGYPWHADEPREAYLRLDTIDYDALIERYRPQLRYHYAEMYRADSAEEMALVSVPPEGQDESWANNLERADGTVLATSDPFLGYPALSLAALPPVRGDNLYAWGDPALDSDRIDARNGTYEQDAALMHQNPSLANRLYARATQGQDGKIWLQYWFFYYYDQGALGIADHEGDWEMIQIGLNSSLAPDVATYAQHAGAQSCSWDRVPKYDGPAGIGPVVFVGIGGHPSLFYADDPPSYFPESGSERVRPAIDLALGNLEPGWATWRGSWGGSAGIANSPRSPGRQGPKWDDPTGFNESAGVCPTQASGAVTARVRAQITRPRRRHRALPAPSLTARFSAKGIVVRYRFSRRAWKQLPRRTGLVLSVRGRKAGSLPRNVILRIRGRTGQRRIGLPLSVGPYTVQGQALTSSGRQSHPTTIHLK